jgi:hypothetical protein
VRDIEHQSYKHSMRRYSGRYCKQKKKASVLPLPGATLEEQVHCIAAKIATKVVAAARELVGGTHEQAA